MIDSFLNTGTNLSMWFILLKLAIMLAVLAKLGFVIKDYVKAGVNDSKLWAKYGRPLTWLVVSIIVAIFLYAAYGGGSVSLQSESGQIGHMDMLDKAPEPNIDSVNKAHENQKPHTLKRQADPGFEEEAKEADEYLKKHGL